MPEAVLLRDSIGLLEHLMVCLVGWLKGVLPDGREGWVPKNVCQQVEDPHARRQNMKNFLLSEEAQRAYNMRKTNEKTPDGALFARVHEVRDTSI